MKNLISARLAGNILLISLGVLGLFHLLVLLGVLPADLVLGGQGETKAWNLMTLESTALLVTAVFALIIATKLDYLEAGKYKKLVGFGVWLIFAYLIFNTIVNLASSGAFERFFFAPVTLLLALFALRLALEKDPEQEAA